MNYDKGHKELKAMTDKRQMDVAKHRVYKAKLEDE